MKIAMVVRNDLEFDARVQKEALALQRAGHEVRVFALAGNRYNPGINLVSDQLVHHVEDVPSFRTSKLVSRSLMVLLSPLILIILALYRTPAIIRIVLRRARTQIKTRLRRARTQIKTRLKKTDKRATAYLNARLAPIRRFHFGKAAADHVIKWAPDVVHMHDLETAFAGLRAKRKTNAHLVYDSHELWLERNEPNRSRISRKLIRAWERHLEQRILRESSGIITVSPGILEDLASRHPNAADKGSIVRNIPIVDEPIGPIASLLKADDETRVIAYSGRITTGRHLELLIHASEELTFPHRLCLLGYGSDAYVSALVDQAAANGVRLEIVDPVHNTAVSPSLTLATVVFVGVNNVARSYELSLPNKFFEALLSGRPVVAPRLPEMMRFGNDLPGIYWYEPHVDSLRSALSRAESDDSLPSVVIEERQARVCWDSEARQLVELYEKLSEINRALPQL